MNKKFICTVCGYIYEGPTPPEQCPQCKVPGSKFKELDETAGGIQFVQEHVIGIAKEYGVDEETVFLMADMLGKDEDFDGLISMLEDYEDIY